MGRVLPPCLDQLRKTLIVMHVAFPTAFRVGLRILQIWHSRQTNQLTLANEVKFICHHQHRKETSRPKMAIREPSILSQSLRCTDVLSLVLTRCHYWGK